MKKQWDFPRMALAFPALSAVIAAAVIAAASAACGGDGGSDYKFF